MCADMIPIENEINQVLQTKSCLYTALFELLKSRPYESITVGQICKKADFSRAVFYNHYHNKDEFLREIFDRIVFYYHTKIERAEQEHQLTETYTHVTWLRVLSKNKEFFLLLERIGKTEWLVEYLASEFDNLFAKLAHEEPTESELFHNYFVTYHAMGVCGLYMKWLKEDEPLPLEQFSGIIMHLYQYKNIRSFLNFLEE